MKQQLLEILRCPECLSKLVLRDVCRTGEEIESAMLVCKVCEKSYPVIKKIPRFVPIQNYAATFGHQWNIFKKTQLDSYSGLPISKNRFFKYTGWSPEELKGKLVLDVGCGMGRFVEIALACGAQVVAVDLSTAVDACKENFAHDSRLEVIQADIRHLPFGGGLFDYVYCLGVLMCTPNPKNSFMALSQQVKSRGKIAVDTYPKLIRHVFWSKYWLRPITKRMPPKLLFFIVRYLVKFLLPVSVIISRIPLIGSKLKYLIPVANFDNVYPLSKEQLREWSILDTFDMLSPAHDHPSRPKELESWFKEAGINAFKVFRSGFLIGRGAK